VSLLKFKVIQARPLCFTGFERIFLTARSWNWSEFWLFFGVGPASEARFDLLKTISLEGAFDSPQILCN
jgi:hypothetical protein